MTPFRKLLSWFRASRSQGELRTVVLRVTVPFAAVCLVGLAMSSWSQVGDARRDFVQRSQESARLYAHALAAPMSVGDAATTRAVAQALAADPAVLAMRITDARGELLHREDGEAPAVGGFLAGMVTATRTEQLDVTRRGESVGTLSVTFFKDGRQHAWRFNPMIVVWMAIGSTLLVMGVAALIARRFGKRYRHILGQVRGTAVTVDGATASLREVSASQSSAAAEASAALSETQAVAAEVGVAAGTAADRARLLDDIARRSELEATEAIRAVTEARDAMQAVHEQSRAIGEAISHFSEKAAAVGEIASTVSALAERSNLLALNAAIEASRAGERGRAFSVVSREMRALAEATNRSATSVKAIITDVQGAVGNWTGDSAEGDRRVEDAERTANAALESIRAFGTSTHQLAGVGKELASAGQEQRNAIDQTVEALKQANLAAAEQLEGIREVEGSAERLTGISRTLVATIDGTEKTDGSDLELRAAAGRRIKIADLLARIVPVTVPLLVFCVVMLTFAFAVRPSFDTLARRAVKERNVGLSTAVAGALATQDLDALRTLLGAAVAQGQATYLLVRDSHGKVVAASGSLPERLEESDEGVRTGTVMGLTSRIPGGEARLSVGYPLDDAFKVRTKSTVMTLAIAVVVFIGGVLIAFVVARQYAQVFEMLLVGVERAARRMDELIGRLAATTAQQSAAAAESSAALSETQASAAEVGRGAVAAAGRAMLLISGGEGCGHDADVATMATAQATDAIRALRTHVAELTGAISGFGDRVDAIGSVATTVSMLAERSDLLAVNAAIEAARTAGAGAGFGVVAEEMRALADGSSRAANQVKEIVADVRGALRRALEDAREGDRRVRAAEALADAASRRVAHFAEVAREFVKVGNELGSAASKQKTAIEQMVEAISQAAESSTLQAAGTDAVQEVARRLVELSRTLVAEVAGNGQSVASLAAVGERPQSTGQAKAA